MLDHFRLLLPRWNLVSSAHGAALRPIIVREQHGLHSEISKLHIAFHNAGDEQALDARVRIRIPARYIRSSRLQNERQRNSHIEIELDRGFFVQNNLFQQLYAGDTTRVVHEMSVYYSDLVPLSSDDDALEVEIRCGNAPPFKASVGMKELQKSEPGKQYMMLPLGSEPRLVPFAGA